MCYAGKKSKNTSVALRTQSHCLCRSTIEELYKYMYVIQHIKTRLL